jgi:hypothetical protein
MGSGCIVQRFLELGTTWRLSGQLHAPSALTPGERAPATHWVVGRVGPRTGLDDVKKRKFLALPGLELRRLGSPARSQSLYGLRSLPH